ncbi:MAG TPA: hypothetical protein VGO87_14525 [Acidimicrobiia bacterium]
MSERNIITRFLSRQRRWLMAGVSVLGVSGLVLGGLASPSWAATASLPSKVDFSQWADVNLHWTTGDLNFSGTNAGTYAEGETVPFAIDVTDAGAGSYSFSLCRDYMEGTVRGYLSLEPYNTSRSPLLTAPVTDAATGSAQPFTGAAVTGSVHIDSVDEIGGPGDCGPDQRETQVQITIAGGPGGAAPAGAMVLFGAHLASPADPGVGPGNGAGQYNGATLAMTLVQAKKTLNIKVAEAGAITVQKVVDSGTAAASQFCFNISPNPAGVSLPLCPAAGQDTVTFLGLTSGNYSVTEAGLAGYTFASGSGTNCQFSAGSAVAAITTGSTTTDASCVFHNRREQGTLTVVDVLNPGTDPGKFNLQIDGSTAGTGANVGDGGTTGQIVVAGGSHGVGAAGGTNTDIADYTTSTSCLDLTLPVVGGLLQGGGGLLGGLGQPVPVTGGSVDVADGQNVLCVVTLTPVVETATTVTAPDAGNDDPTTTTTTIEPTTVIDPLPSSTTTTTIKKHKPTDDDNPGDDDSAPVETPSSTTTTTAITIAPQVDPGTSVAGINDQTGTPAPEQVLGGELERAAPAPMPAATLPRTGRGIGGEVLAAFALLIAGLALRFSQRRKPAGQR